MPFTTLSDKELNSLLRRASNHIEMIDRPDHAHHVDDDERRRIGLLTTAARAELRIEAMTIINNVRAEFRRRFSG